MRLNETKISFLKASLDRYRLEACIRYVLAKKKCAFAEHSY